MFERDVVVRLRGPDDPHRQHREEDDVVDAEPDEDVPERTKEEVLAHGASAGSGGSGGTSRQPRMTAGFAP